MLKPLNILKAISISIKNFIYLFKKIRNKRKQIYNKKVQGSEKFLDIFKDSIKS